MQQSGIEENKPGAKDEGSKGETSALNSKIQEGVNLYRMKDWDKALKEFLSLDKTEFSFDEKNEIAYYLGLCYTKLGQYDEALTYLEQVVTLGADILRVYQCRMTLAYIYVITKRVRMAEYELKRLQSSGMESPILYNTLAYAAWVQKQNKNAIELYEKTLEIDTDNATAMNCMGFILADSGMDIMRALRLCRRAVDFKPQNAAYLDSLGWAYYKSGEILEARTWLRRALDIAPDEKEIQRHFKIVSGDRK
ncbi:MAG: tetratricopeptide repeat protein [Treponema sp.]|jgi:tetratricopeptide (TPR) repeat protein|nr:tetratricopeptide repeat protein [Treponema sp.]